MKTFFNKFKKILFLFSLLLPLGCWADCDQPETPYCSLQPSHVDASIISSSKVLAIYPAISKRLGESGTVVLSLLVTSNGDVGAVELKVSSGYPRLDDSAVDAVKKWKFTPAIMGGKTIDEWYLMPYVFILPTDEKKMRTSPCLNDYVAQGIYKPIDSGWKRAFPSEEIYVRNISRPPDTIKSWSELLNLDGKDKNINRQMFELIKNNVSIKSSVLGSLSSYRVFDCTNNQIYVLQESLFSCQWGSGNILPIKDGVQLKKWMPVPTGSKDAELLEYVCSKGY
jgi:TonB family protein